MDKKYRVVLDTNVFISASFVKISPIPNLIYSALKNQRFILVTSPFIIEEIDDVLNRDYIVKHTGMTAKQRKRFIQEVIDFSLLVSGNPSLQVIKADPDDDKFLHAAIEGNADFIVSGDKHLLDLKAYAGIKILTPKGFLQLLLT